MATDYDGSWASVVDEATDSGIEDTPAEEGLDGQSPPGTPQSAASSSSGSSGAMPLRRSYAFSGRCMMSLAQMRQHPVESAERAMSLLVPASGGDCSVCLASSPTGSGPHSPSHKGEKVRLTCGHVFHRQCLREWLLTRARDGCQPNCPNCRAEIPTS